MKKYVIVCAIMLTFNNLLTYAQDIPVVDPAHIAVTIANGFTLDDQKDKLAEQVAVSFLIEQKVTDIYKLQEDYKEFLKQAETVNELQWADLLKNQAHAMALQIDMDAYVPAYENITTLKEVYATLEGIGGGEALYQQLDGLALVLNYHKASGPWKRCWKDYR